MAGPIEAQRSYEESACRRGICLCGRGAFGESSCASAGTGHAGAALADRRDDEMKTNILLITRDQHHYSCLGYNNDEVKTPNLDRLAAAGMIFDRAYCPNPLCTPSRASIITGMYPSQHGAWALGTKLPEAIHVVGDDFKAAGYRTALIGKAHFQPIVQTEDAASQDLRQCPLQDHGLLQSRLRRALRP